MALWKPGGSYHCGRFGADLFLSPRSFFTSTSDSGAALGLGPAPCCHIRGPLGPLGPSPSKCNETRYRAHGSHLFVSLDAPSVIEFYILCGKYRSHGPNLARRMALCPARMRSRILRTFCTCGLPKVWYSIAFSPQDLVFPCSCFLASCVPNLTLYIVCHSSCCKQHHISSVVPANTFKR